MDSVVSGALILLGRALFVRSGAFISAAGIDDLSPCWTPFVDLGCFVVGVWLPGAFPGSRIGSPVNTGRTGPTRRRELTRRAVP